MYWLFLLLALGCFTMALKATHTGMMVLWLLGTLVLLLVWVRGLYVARFGNLQRDISTVIDPLELRRLREQAQARRATDEDASNAP